ncbi:MAG: tetratricopeptide repeat protein [Deltaproteobacteria bacterium]|nr:tetratricopeptide repeat protein [Deltaproteobacteria bacterium]
MAKSYTRNKELKQPDEFISLSHRAWTFISDHATRVLVMLGVAVVIVAAAWTWSYFREAQAEKATAAFGRALDIYYAPVSTEPAKAAKDDDDDTPHFSTRLKKLEAAETEFSKVVDGHAGKEVARMALLLRAGVRFERARFDEAIADYDRFLKESTDKALRTSALEGLIYCYEARNLLDKAIETIKKLPGEGEQRYLALYHEGRILALKGQVKEAVARFKQIQQKGSPALASRAGERLAMLEGK